MLSPEEERKFTNDLEALGRREVRVILARGFYGEHKRRIAESWVAEKEREAIKKRWVVSCAIALGCLVIAALAYCTPPA